MNGISKEDPMVQRAIDNQLFKTCLRCNAKTMCGKCSCNKPKSKD
jgi:hypothetical protein